ncbi:MAG: UvrD-helicase domain-containing protein [Acidimicrobiia bacterium]
MTEAMTASTADSTAAGPAVTLVDEGVRRLITTDGLDALLFVEAGAGTGKTKQLVDRVVSLVLARDVPMREIAAITFTEAAASELRSRVREAVERVVHSADATAATANAPSVVTAADRERADAALADLDSAAIGTVHAFAQRILSEHPVEAGLPPSVEVLDEVESLLEFGRRWQEEVDRMFATPELAPIITVARLLDVRVDHPKLVSLRDIASVFADNWDRLDSLVDLPVVIPQLDRLDAIEQVRRLEPVLARCAEIPDDKLAQRLLAGGPEMGSVLRALEHGDDRAVVRQLIAKRKSKKWGHGNAGTAANWGGKDEKAAVGATVAATEAALENILEQAADDVLRVLAGEVARFTVRSAHERLGDGRLEFHDLLVFARRLLRESRDARTALHARYTRLLIDEFQDTDPIQVELATLIAASVGEHDPKASWQDVQVDDERLFFVGDPKQSIYRFRRADIGLFLAARDRFAGESVRLTTNFRTVPPVLDWVNHVFGALMDEEIPGRRPQYEPLHSHRHSSSHDHRVVLLGGPHPKEEKLRAGPLRELEAGTVAAAVAEILAHPEDWPVEADGEWRAARPEDIAILVPTRTSLGVLMDALRDHDVDVRAETGTLVYETQEIRDLLSVLRAVAYGTDAVALVAALRSPILACGDDDLVIYAHAGGKWSVTAPRPDLPEDHPVMAALGFLARLHEARWWTPPSQLIDWIVRERRLLTIGLAQRRARDTWRRIRFLADQARVFEASQSGDLVAFVDWADLQRSEMARVHEPILPEADDHAVRIMTIHGAKGLEFPITVVSGLTTRLLPRRGRVAVRWDGDEIGVSTRKDIATAGFDRLADLEDEMDGEEKLRLLYVACTRARDHLLVATHHVEGVPSFAQLAWTHSHDAPADCWRESEIDGRSPAPVTSPIASTSVPNPETIAAEMDERAEWLARRSKLLDTGRATRTVSATDVRRSGATGAHGFRHRWLGAPIDSESTEIPDPATVWRQGSSATAFGRAVHAVLQDADLATGANIDSLAATIADAEGLADHVDDVASAARSVLAAEMVRAAAVGIETGDAFREMYVAAPVGERVIEGYIDLLVRTPEGLVVVDYKTDPVTDTDEIDRRVEEYRLQLAAYALAVEVVTGTAVSAGVLVFARAEGMVERRIEAQNLGLAEVRSIVGGQPLA